MKLIKGANLALRFILELSAVAITAAWGFKTGSGASRWLLAIAAPAVVVAVWALFVSPNPTVELPALARLLIEFAVWVAALAATGHRTLAIAFAVVAVISGTLNHLWA